jgi:hypothetical protein
VKKSNGPAALFLLLFIIFTASVSQRYSHPNYSHPAGYSTSSGYGLDNDCYHKTWTDTATGYKIGQLGAIRYLLDKDGKHFTGGYHEYFKKDGVVYGQWGSETEVVIDAKGKINRHGGFEKWLSTPEQKALSAEYEAYSEKGKFSENN